MQGDPFQNLMYTNATVSNVQYDNVSDKTGFAAEVKLGVAFGIDLSLETTDSRAVDATYLDVPGTNGTRAPVDFPSASRETRLGSFGDHDLPARRTLERPARAARLASGDRSDAAGRAARPAARQLRRDRCPERERCAA